MKQQEPYQPQNTIRVVTAASLFDGHDASINVMRRIIQSTGCEVIHLGHNRSVAEVVTCAIQEDANAIAITSYQGGHLEYFKYMLDLLREHGAGHILIFGGGGGTILPDEIEELSKYGVTRIYSPDDGRSMGLQGMINDLVQKSDRPTPQTFAGQLMDLVQLKNHLAIAQAITCTERGEHSLIEQIESNEQSPVLGITGTGGAGKSSLTDELIRRFTEEYPERSIAILSVDPTRRRTGGALLGDRIRMNAVHHPNVYMRSMATRQINTAVNQHITEAIRILSHARFDLVIVETAGIGQSDTAITDIADLTMYVMTPEYGAATQLEKIDMLDYADIVVLNKFDKRGASDALRAVQKQVQRNHRLFETVLSDMPVYGTIASQYNDAGTNQLYTELMSRMKERFALEWVHDKTLHEGRSEKIYIIPPERNRYLSEIAENNDRYDSFVDKQTNIARRLWHACSSIEELQKMESK